MCKHKIEVYEVCRDEKRRTQQPCPAGVDNLGRCKAGNDEIGDVINLSKPGMCEPCFRKRHEEISTEFQERITIIEGRLVVIEQAEAAAVLVSMTRPNAQDIEARQHLRLTYEGYLQDAKDIMAERLLILRRDHGPKRDG